MTGKVVHDTLVFERSFAQPPAAVFKAFADPDLRARWGRPSPEAVILYDAADFRVGGRDLSRCGSAQDPRYAVEATYLDIVDGQRITYSETVSQGGCILSAALYTIEIGGNAKRSELKVTAQMASFAGGAMRAGVMAGFTAALANLEAEFAKIRP